MKTSDRKEAVARKAGGYLATIAAAILGVLFLGDGKIALGLIAIVLSFSSNYYAEY